MNTDALPPIAHGDGLVVVVCASGAGKDSLLRAWRATPAAAGVHVAQRVVTRPPDPSEGHEAVTGSDFAGLRARGLLATWWQAHGLDYGVRHAQFEPLAGGSRVVLNGSRAHLPALRRQAPGLRVVEVRAPAHALASRLAARGREDAPGRQARLARSLEPVADAELVLLNDGELQDCVDAFARWWTAG